ncbi:MAG: MFS transporter [Dehalococcoidia bacterium]|nr:MFS transporter [Dehalococcoidia bacterium]
MVNQMIVSGLGGQGFGAFILPLQNEFGWGKSTLSVARSLTQVESGLLNPLEGTLVDRLGPRIMVVSGMTVFGSGLVLLGFVHSLWMYYIAFIVIALGSSLAGMVVVSTAINNWFRHRLTMALSISQTGQGFGGIILVPLLVWAIVVLGWREAAIAAGVFSWIVGIPMGLLMRHKPEQYGMRPDGEPEVVSSTAQELKPETKARPAAAQGRVDFTLGEAIRTPAFWLIGMGHGFSVMVVGAVTTHQFAHMEMADGVGLSSASATLVVTVLNIVNVSGRFSVGLIGDRFDKRYIAAIGNLMGSAALAMFALAHSMGLAMGYAVLFGISWGIRGPLMSSIRSDYFGRAHFGKILGTSQLIATFLAIIAPVFAGIMADWQGNYRLAFIILAFISALGAVSFLLVKPPKPPRREPQDATIHPA